jgi:hypothetical protein
VSISFNAHNVTGQAQTTLDGKTVITGSGGVAASATDHSPTVQAAREQIAGTVGDDIIYGDGGSDMGPGFARVLEIQLSAKNALEVSSVTLTGLPAGFIPVGATQQGNSWELKLPSDLAASGNLLTVMLQYPVASDDSAFNATPFTLSISASGTMDGKTISGQLLVMNSVTFSPVVGGAMSPLFHPTTTVSPSRNSSFRGIVKRIVVPAVVISASCPFPPYTPLNALDRSPCAPSGRTISAETWPRGTSHSSPVAFQ